MYIIVFSKTFNNRLYSIISLIICDININIRIANIYVSVVDNISMKSIVILSIVEMFRTL